MKLDDYKITFSIIPTDTVRPWWARRTTLPLTPENWREAIFYKNGKLRKGIKQIYIKRDDHVYAWWTLYDTYNKCGPAKQWELHTHNGLERVAKPYKTYAAIRSLIIKNGPKYED